MWRHRRQTGKRILYKFTANEIDLANAYKQRFVRQRVKLHVECHRQRTERLSRRWWRCQRRGCICHAWSKLNWPAAFSVSEMLFARYLLLRSSQPERKGLSRETISTGTPVTCECDYKEERTNERVRLRAWRVQNRWLTMRHLSCLLHIVQSFERRSVAIYTVCMRWWRAIGMHVNSQRL
jgi:hypothetical protein